MFAIVEVIHVICLCAACVRWQDGRDGRSSSYITSTSTSTRSTVVGALTRAQLTTTVRKSQLPTAHVITTYRSLLFNLTINLIPKREKTAKERFEK
jgi:hypothetical protein